MAQTSAINTVRKIEHRSYVQLTSRCPQPARNDNSDVGGGLCPMCKGFASIGPLVAEYRGNGLFRRHWQCRACGHDWTTVLHVLT